jgi:hypothetical protein
MELTSLRLSRRPSYTVEQQHAAWRAFVRAPHGQVLLDLLVHQAFLVQHGDVRGLGQHDLMLWVIAKIQEAEEHYGRGNDRQPALEPPGEHEPPWWLPRDQRDERAPG